MKKFISLSLSATLFMSACAPNKQVIVRKNDETQNTEDEKKKALNVEQDLVSLWKDLNVGSNPNMAVAEIIFRTMSSDTRTFLRSGTLATGNQFLVEYSSEKDALKRDLLAGKTAFAHDPNVLAGTRVASMDGATIKADEFVADYDWAYQREIRERAVKSINDTFVKRSQELAKDIAVAVVQKLDNQEVLQIESAKGDKQQKIKEILEVLKKADRVLVNYDFHKDDETKLLVMTMIAGAIASEVMQNKTVQHWIKVAQDAAQTAQKVQDVFAMLKIANKSRQEMKKNWQSMKENMDAFVDDVTELKNIGLRDSTKSEVKRLLNDVVHGNLKESKEDAPGILASKKRLNKNLQGFVASAGDAADNLGTILKSADSIFAAFNIKPSPDLAKTLNTAKSVVSGVSLAKKVFQAYGNGGIIGAISAFSQGGGLSSLGICAEPDPMAAELAAIRAELAEIKQMQQKMMELQIDTMKMIQELANILQSYHLEQMYALAEIRQELSLVREAQQVELHSKIRTCQYMMAFAMSGTDSKAYNSSKMLSVPRSVAFAQITDRKALERFINSMGEDAFKECQNGIVSAFGSSDPSGTPLLLSANDDLRLAGAFSKENYRPLVTALKISPDSFGLHLPSNSISTLEKKLDYSSSMSLGYGNNYWLEQLISTEALERYVSALLLMGPIVSYDKQDWKTYLSSNVLNNQNQSWDRYDRWLRNALSSVQSALAQESVLAGEPILSELAVAFPGILKESSNCVADVASRTGIDSKCAVKQNVLIRRNLFIYVANKRLDSFRYQGAYEKARETNDIAAMESILGPEFVGHIVVKKGVLALDWNNQGRIKEPLPSANEISLKQLIYSENVPRLVVLQQKIVDAILEIKPTFLGSKAQKDLLTAIAVKN